MAEICEMGYGCTLVLFKVGCRGFPAASLKRFPKCASIQKPNKAIKTCGGKQWKALHGLPRNIY